MSLTHPVSPSSTPFSASTGRFEASSAILPAEIKLIIHYFTIYHLQFTRNTWNFQNSKFIPTPMHFPILCLGTTFPALAGLHSRYPCQPLFLQQRSKEPGAYLLSMYPRILESWMRDPWVRQNRTVRPSRIPVMIGRKSSPCQWDHGTSRYSRSTVLQPGCFLGRYSN